MKLYFITGSVDKWKEAQVLFPALEQLDIDLPEIQDIHAETIIRSKLTAAYQHAQGKFIVEDTSLYFDCLHGLPGPLIKWFLKSLGNDGLSGLAVKYKNRNALAKTIIGYAENKQSFRFFEGTIAGTIVPPRGENGFGWDAIFQPSGSNKTFAEMTHSEKSKCSMRNIALQKLLAYITAS